jgi:hypothetical protein
VGVSRPSLPRTGYLTEVHLEMVVVLVVILAVLVGVGWSLRPQSSGFPKVPENVSLQAEANGVRTVSEALHRTADNGAVLRGQRRERPGHDDRTWILAIGNLGGARSAPL